MAEQKKVDGSLALQDKQCRIITIEATDRPHKAQLRVAAYTRVSSSSEDQLNSFAAQNRYYTDLISGKENWRMVDIYADEGITGTSALKRDDFQRMLSDCRRGRIDRILVKSISRFARNTPECLTAIRELKQLGVSVYFEKENIDTSAVSSELMTAIHAAFSQSESFSISTNMQWSYLRRMQNGTYIPSSMPYGYRLVNNVITINQEEAPVVRRIFCDYLGGKSMDAIAYELNRDGIPKSAEDATWYQSSLRYILRNERYIGDSLWQKTYTENTFPTTQHRNRGERDMYYMEGTHPAIIEKEDFEAVQRLLSRRVSGRTSGDEKTAWSNKLYCGLCDSSLRRTQRNDGVAWCCRRHYMYAAECEATPVLEKHIIDAFLRLYYNLKHHGTAILTEMLDSLVEIRNRRLLWSMDVIELNNKISDLYSQNHMLTEFRERGLIDPDIFIAQSNELTEQLRAAKLEKERLLVADSDNTIPQTRELMETLEAGPDFLDSFDAELFGELIDRVIVDSNEQLRFRLKNGLELTERIERTVR